MAHILSVSYDEVLLCTRRMLLELHGYSVISGLGFKESLEHCRQGGFDLFLLGHSIPRGDKQELIRAFRKSCPAPIISLQKRSEPDTDGATYYVEPEPEIVLNLVAGILDK